MQSKSLEIFSKTSEGKKHSKSFDFIKYYKSANESNISLAENQKLDNTSELITKSSNKKKSKNESIDISTINIDGSNLKQHSGRSSPVTTTKVTSTPKVIPKKSSKKVKSIMKNSSDVESINEYTPEKIYKSKKRNKSVSFMLDDNEDLVVKKSKSEDSLAATVKDKLKFQKHNLKKQKRAEKENEVQTNHVKIECDTSDKKFKKSAEKREKDKPLEPLNVPEDDNQVEVTEKKKRKRPKKSKPIENNKDVKAHSSNDGTSEHHAKKLKKKKRLAKIPPETEVEEEPAKRSRKDDTKHDIETGIENLNIGDNTHTLTGLLDKMTVVDKKNKTKKKKELHKEPSNDSSAEEKTAEEKEKVKWAKRKWNKDKKGLLNEDRLLTSIVVENLPLSIVMHYRKLVTELFSKYGVVQHVGVAELYPTEDPKPVFCTTVYFENEDAATKSLEEDNSVFAGGRISVKRPLSATLTTVVARSYGELTEQALCSVFFSAGRIRHIRHLVKGKKSLSTAFIEFDGPEAVERAMRLAEDAKIGGKRIHVSRFEIRKGHKHKKPKRTSENQEEHNESSD